MWQSFIQPTFHCPAVHDKRIDNVLVACREVVVVVSIGVKKLDDGPAAIKCGGHRELQQIVGEKDAFSDRDGRMQASNDSVQILDWRLEFEGLLIVGAEPPVESSTRPERVVREDHAI